MEVIVGDVDGRTSEFGRDVALGFTRRPHGIPSRWLFDSTGVRLLRRLRKAGTSYLLESERQLLADRSYALPLYFPRHAPTVIEIGVVDVPRSLALLDPLLEAFPEIAYTAVGPDREAVEEPCHALATSLPRLRVSGLVGRIEDAVRELRATSAPVLLFWPDAGVADLPRHDCIALLRGVAAALRPRDLLVATIDLRKDPRAVQRVYRDPDGLAKQLHLHLLDRVDAELGGDFDVAGFRHRFAYDEETGELSTQLVARRAQTARVADARLDITLSKGDTIDTLTATKFSPQEIDHAAHAAQLIVHERWYDRDGRACANLMRSHV